MTVNSIHDYIRRFITDYLPNVRKASAKTIKAYTTGLNGFRLFLKKHHKIEFIKLSFGDFSSKNVNEWLEYLKYDKFNKDSTLNLRLSAVRNFIHYCSGCSVEYTAIYNELREIKEFKTQKAIVASDAGIKFLTEEQLKLLFSLPDAEKPKGRRDRMFMILAYETGARLSELLDIRLKDIIDDNGNVIILIHKGKGNKSRYVPVPDAVVKHLKSYLREFHPDNIQNDFLFYISHNGNRLRMDNSTAEAFVKTYGQKAYTIDESFPKNLHPHMFRHSLGTALYRKGVPLSYIADLFGHESLDSTKIYSKSDIKILHKKVSEVNKDINNKIGKVKTGKLWVGKENELLKICGLK